VTGGSKKEILNCELLDMQLSAYSDHIKKNDDRDVWQE
jgi:hypothetical protein